MAPELDICNVLLCQPCYRFDTKLLFWWDVQCSVVCVVLSCVQGRVANARHVHNLQVLRMQVTMSSQHVCLHRPMRPQECQHASPDCLEVAKVSHSAHLDTRLVYASFGKDGGQFEEGKGTRVVPCPALQHPLYVLQVLQLQASPVAAVTTDTKQGCARDEVCHIPWEGLCQVCHQYQASTCIEEAFKDVPEAMRPEGSRRCEHLCS